MAQNPTDDDMNNTGDDNDQDELAHDPQDTPGIAAKKARLRAKVREAKGLPPTVVTAKRPAVSDQRIPISKDDPAPMNLPDESSSSKELVKKKILDAFRKAQASGDTDTVNRMRKRVP